MEYCVPAGFLIIRRTDILEKVQRRAKISKLVNKFHHLSFEETKKIESVLARRRKRGDLIEEFKILNKLENIDDKIFFDRSSTMNLRGHICFKAAVQKLFKSSLRCRNFISQRVINNWNSLPEHVVVSDSLNI